MRRRRANYGDNGAHMITKQRMWGLRLATAVVSLLAVVDATGYDGPVEKQVFTMASYTTVGGKALKNVRVGYETYGKLNAAGDNAIFIPHFFSGNSHAAGKYKPSDAAPGYWDPIIGAGKASGAMAKALEDSWEGPLEGLVVTRYGYRVPTDKEFE